ncbi:MAG TPA: hypothetical protein PKG75_10435, partial [Clostridiales bacterium]|nr:hypothetical protein [Clostridiales bacterium]
MASKRTWDDVLRDRGFDPEKRKKQQAAKYADESYKSRQKTTISQIEQSEAVRKKQALQSIAESDAIKALDRLKTLTLGGFDETKLERPPMVRPEAWREMLIRNTPSLIEVLPRFEEANAYEEKKKPAAAVDTSREDEWARRDQDIRQIVFTRGLEELDEKYKGMSTQAKLASPEYKADLARVAASAGYSLEKAGFLKELFEPEERNRMYSAEATTSALPYLAEKAKIGLSEFARGLSALDTIGRSDSLSRTPSIEQQIQAMQSEDLAKFAEAEARNVPRGLKLAGDIVQGAAGMIPSMIMSAVNPTMGLQMMGLSAAGSSAQEAMSQGASKAQALAYGGLSGAIEVGTEYLFGGIPFMKGVGDKVTESVVKPIENRIIRTAISKGLDGIGEAVEEIISGALDPYARRITFDPDAETATAEDLLYEGAIGFGVSALLGLPETIVDASGRTQKTIKGIDSVDKDGNIVITLGDDSHMVVNPSKMSYEDLETLKSYLPDVKNKQLSKPMQEVKKVIDKAMSAKEVKNEQVIQRAAAIKEARSRVSAVAEAPASTTAKVAQVAGIDTAAATEAVEPAEPTDINKQTIPETLQETAQVTEQPVESVESIESEKSEEPVKSEKLSLDEKIAKLKKLRAGMKEGSKEYRAITKRIEALEAEKEKVSGPVHASEVIPEIAPVEKEEVFTPKTDEATTITSQQEEPSAEVTAKEVQTEPEARTTVQPISAEKMGNETAMLTNDGTEIKARYAVVSADELITSHNTDMSVNPNYPQELQPRQRERAASIVEVDKMSKNIQPELLGENIKISDGAPIVGDDGIVESGNGRVIALKKMYESGNDAKYREWLEANKDKFGIAGELPDKPVLVRVRTTDVDRVAFTKMANESSVAAMSATETARSDAEKISDDLLNLFVPNDEGAINTPENKTFIQRFLNDVVPSNEHARLVTKEGLLSQDGYNRIRNALFYRAYGDLELLDMLTEDLDAELKNVIKAMVANAPRIALIKQGIKDGVYYDLDFSDDIVYAAKQAIALKRKGMKVAEFVNQVSLFEGPTNVQHEILTAFEKYNRSAKKINMFIRFISDAVIAAGNPDQIAMFDNIAPTKNDIMETVLRRMRYELEGVVEGQTVMPVLQTEYEGSAETVRTDATEGAESAE